MKDKKTQRIGDGNTPSTTKQENNEKAGESECKKHFKFSGFFCFQKRSEMMILAIAVLIVSTAATAAIIYAAGIRPCQTATMFMNHYE